MSVPDDGGLHRFGASGGALISPARARVVLLVAMAVEVGSAAVLVPQAMATSIPLRHLPTWIESVGAPEVLVAAGTWAGAAVALWLLCATTCSLLAATGRTVANRVAALVAPRLLVRLCALAMSPAMALGPATATAIEAPIPPPVEAPTVEEAPGFRTPTPAPPGDVRSPAPNDDVRDSSPMPQPREEPPDDQPPNAPAAGTVTVVSGDNLWAMTARHLAAARGVDRRTLTDAEIAEVWRVVVRENRSRLRSGDPDLIFPGESVLLPGP